MYVLREAYGIQITDVVGICGSSSKAYETTLGLHIHRAQHFSTVLYLAVTAHTAWYVLLVALGESAYMCHTCNIAW